MHSDKKNIYLIDTNSIIRPYKLFYPFDLVPNFWGCMKSNIEKGNIIILSKVYDELISGEDVLCDLVRKLDKSFFSKL